MLLVARLFGALSLARVEALRAAALAAATSTLFVALGPPGGDEAAHVYRTMLVRDGVYLWDNLWYSGHYPLASYSPLYYFAAALVGNHLLVALAAVVAAWLFAEIVFEEWGEAARWPARAFGIVAPWPLYAGTYSYGVGVAAALASLRLVQTGRAWSAVACAAVTLAVSPLAFVLLVVVVGASAWARRRFDARIAGGLAVLATAQLALLAAFPTEAEYPYNRVSLLGAVALSAFGIALAARTARTLAAVFVVWGGVNVAAFFVASPLGDNLTRLRAIAFPLMLLAATLARFRPRVLAFPALALALYMNVGPDLLALPKREADRASARAALWSPALDFLRSRATPDHRVEVVPTFDHWEAYWLPSAGFALARGWYRQLDITTNPELYREPLRPRAYRAWLRRTAVRYVLLPHVRLGPMGAANEARLLESGAAGLARVYRDRRWTIYEVRRATPILERGRVLRLEHDRVTAAVPAPGTYRLRIRHTRFWEASGAVCVERRADGTTNVVAHRAGRFELRASVRGGAEC